MSTPVVKKTRKTAKPTFAIAEVFPETDNAAFRDIVILHDKIFPGSSAFLPTYGWWWLVFAKDGKPVAFAGLVPLNDDCDEPEETPTNSDTKFTPSKTHAYLCRGGVLEAYRGNGLQRRLIEVRQVKAHEVGMHVVATTTFNNPYSSNNLYAAGFRMFEPEDPWGCEGTCYWEYMIKGRYDAPTK